MVRSLRDVPPNLRAETPGARTSATATTTITKPPYHCSHARVSLAEADDSPMLSTSEKPVVVRPDIASKNASRKVSPKA